MKLQRKNGLRATALGALAVTGAMVLTACGSDDNGGGSAGSSASASASSSSSSSAAGGIKCDGSGQVLVSGSTAQQNAVNTWVKNFQQACSGIQITYQGNGSGAGVTQFLQGATAFAGSDSPLTPEQITQSKSSVCKSGQAIDLPMVGGPISIVYNVPGVKNLVLDAPTLAKIFNSKITKWNDPAIKKLNPSATLPSTAIQPFHRSDDSGTTDNFTKYLIAAAKSDWPYSGGKTWQAKGGQSAQGSANVASQVKQTAGAIGYAELSYATSDQLDTVQLNTGASAPVSVSSDAASKAIADAKVVGTGPDLALQLNYNTTAAGAWPITLVTSEILCDKGNKASTLPAAKSFLTYMASADAQGQLAAQGYAPLPDAIATKVRAAISSLS